MAQTDSPCGLMPYEEILRARYYKLTNNYGSDVFINDPVVRVAAGTIELATAGATNQILGSVIGLYKQYGAKTDRPEQLFPIQYFQSAWDGTFDYWALVADHPDQIYLAQSDNNDALVSADRFVNANIIFTHSGNVYSGISGAEINGSSEGTDITYQLTVIEPAPVYDPKTYTFNTYGAFAKWICTIQLHQLRTGRAGV
jgi:hypothetical protein